MKKLVTITFLSLFAMNAFSEIGTESNDSEVVKLAAFNSMDTNGDGFISAIESKTTVIETKMLVGLNGQFEKLDANKDKRLSRDEFMKFRFYK